MYSSLEIENGKKMGEKRNGKKVCEGWERKKKGKERKKDGRVKSKRRKQEEKV